MIDNDEFKGPIHLSHRICYQEGDQSPYSNDSIPFPQPFLKKNTLIDEEQMGSKPQFMKLIIAKKLQNAFIKNLWNHSYLRKTHQLTKYQIKQSDDLQIENSNIKSKTDFWNLIDVFTPFNKFIVFWNVFQILILLLIFFWLPYRISFQSHTMSELFSEEENQSTEFLILIILTLDVAVGINTAYIHKGQLVRARGMILRHYFNQTAFLDLVSFFTISASFFVPNDSFELKMIFLQSGLCLTFYVLRIAKINKILASIQEFFNLSGYLNDLVGLFKVLMVIVGVVHIFGCIWHGIAFYNSSYSWLDAYDLRHKSNVSRYNVAIYWATMTMTTVGYGDITAKNDLELLFNNLTMFLGSIVFAYSVNSIGIFVTNMYKGTIEYSKTVSLINTFMSKNKIPFELQTKIRSYLEYIWQEEQNMNDDEVGPIINKLSKNLQEEIQYQLRGNILKQCKILNKLFSESFLKSLLHYVEEQSYCPEERIISMGENDDCALYIITKGEVELIFEGEQMNNKIKRNTLKTCQHQDSFGDVSFLTGHCRTLTAISCGFTRVMKLKREHLLSIIKSFPDDYEKYCELRDKAGFKDLSKLEIPCYSCQSTDHMVDKCNFLHYCADSEKVIKKELYPVIQQRIKFRRKEKLFSRNSLTSLKQITKCALDLNFDLLKNVDDVESHPEEDEEDQDQENQITNRKSVPSSLLQNLEINELQDLSKKNKQLQSHSPGFGGDDKDSNSGKLQLYDTPSSNNSSDLHNVKSPRINLQLPRSSIRHSRQLSKLYENKMLHRKSVDQQTLVNQLGKSDIEISHKQQRKSNTQINHQPQNENPSLETIQAKALDFDKMCNFQFYCPYYNIDPVLRRYCKIQKTFGKRKNIPDFSLYAFNQTAIKKGWKLRRLSQQTRSKSQSKKNKAGVSQRSIFYI